MRVRLPLGRSLFFLSAFLFSLLALLPLRIAADWLGLEARGFAAREAIGSIWLGGFSEVQFGSMPIGDLQAQLRTLPLLAGRARVDLTRRDEANRFEGSTTVARHSFGFDDLKGKIETGSVFAPLPITSLDLDDVSVRYADGVCAQAEGKVGAAVAGEIAGISLPGGLTGNARCDRGAVLLPLVSQSGMEMLDIRLMGNGRFEARLGVRPTNPAFQERLLASGFMADRNGLFSVRVEGKN